MTRVVTVAALAAQIVDLLERVAAGEDTDVIHW
ncbi:hypothetical protein BH20ACT5_BH20ACT5_09230 [soil metagenome]